MAKMYALDNALLTGRPEIRIGDKVYAIDDRTSTVKKLTKLDTDDTDDILKLAFGKDYKDIAALDMPFKAHLALVKLVTAAMTGEDEDAVEARFQQDKSTG